MNVVLQNLLILQERDTKVFEAKEVINKIPAEATKIKSGLQAKLKELEEAKKRVQAAELAVKQVDLDRQVRKDTITKLKMRQGETKRNEEYQMLAHEIIRYGAEIDELETKELECMEAVDLCRQQQEEAKENFALEKQIATERSQNLLQSKKNAEEQLKEFTAESKKAAQNVEPEALTLYERLKVRRGVKTIVLINEAGQCMGCNLKLPPSTFHQVLADTELVQCSECSSILYNA